VHTISLEYGLALSLLTGILVSWIAIPPIVRTAQKKKLVTELNGRTSHKGAIPSLGGIAIFAAAILGSLIWMQNADFKELRFILAGLTIIFFIGLKDDLVNLGWIKKILAETLAAFLLVVVADVRITTFHGVFGIETLTYGWSVAFSMFVCLALINCFNLLDGIDGLASGMAIFISVVFGLWLYWLGLGNYAILSFALAGSLVPFFFFNVFGKKNKLFMGDSGSLMLGFLFSVLAIKILCCEISPESKLYMRALPAVVMGVMILPMFDTIRVFIWRIIRGKSPFAADRTHLHHVFLDLNFSHIQASGAIIGINICLAVLTFAIRDLDPTLATIILFGSALVISLIPCYLANSLYNRQGKATIKQHH